MQTNICIIWVELNAQKVFISHKFMSRDICSFINCSIDDALICKFEQICMLYNENHLSCVGAEGCSAHWSFSNAGRFLLQGLLLSDIVSIFIYLQLSYLPFISFYANFVWKFQGLETETSSQIVAMLQQKKTRTLGMFKHVNSMQL